MTVSILQQTMENYLRGFLFNVCAHLFDIDSLLGHRILLMMIGNDL